LFANIIETGLISKYAKILMFTKNVCIFKAFGDTRVLLIFLIFFLNIAVLSLEYTMFYLNKFRKSGEPFKMNLLKKYKILTFFKEF
jgi:hypothetical protein